MNKIKFYSKYFSFLEKPIPSKKSIPDFYKNMSRSEKIDYPKYGTVKRCIPFLDAMTCGYYICSSIDIIFKKKEDGSVGLHVHDGIDIDFINKMNIGISNHTLPQIGKPKDFFYENEINIVWKFNNPWTIKTPKGYSCFFTNPTNRKLDYRVLEGIVDTDNFIQKINFPFILKDFDDYFILRKGTPLILVFPFKRDSWKMEIHNTEPTTEEETFKFLSVIMDGYKKLSWKKKEYD